MDAIWVSLRQAKRLFVIPSMMTSSFCSILLFEHDLVGQPVPTFPDHAPGTGFGMTATVLTANGTAERSVYPPRAAVVSWIFFDWAAQPYFTLITTLVFAP